MLKLKKIGTLALSFLLAAGLLAGCSSGKKESSTASTEPEANASQVQQNNEEAKDLLEEIQSRGKIVVGMNAEFAPFEFHTMVDGKDTLAGLDVSLANEIAKDLGVEVEFKELAFDALLTTVQNGQVDVIISAMAAKPDRLESVDFSDFYFEGIEVALVRKENLDQYNSFADLEGKKIGLQLSSLQDTLMSELMPEGDYTRIESMNTLFLSLQSKQLDAIITDITVSKMAAQVNPEFAIAEKVVIDSSTLNNPGIGVVLRKGDENSALKAQLNSTIKRLQDAGEIDKMMDEAIAVAAEAQLG